MKTNKKTNKLKHFLAIFFSVIIFFISLIVFNSKDEKGEEDNKIHKNTLKQLIVTVQKTYPITTNVMIKTNGRVLPRWTTHIKANNQGELIKVSKGFEQGTYVKKDSLLVELDDNKFQTSLADSKHQVAIAQLLLQTEKQNGMLAKKQWENHGAKKKPTDYLLRIPQIKAAKAQLNLSETKLKEVNRMSQYSKISAPYNGVITARNVNYGDVINSGQIIGTIISSDNLVIKIKLSVKQWRLLPTDWLGKVVNVSPMEELNDNDELDKIKWTALIDRGGDVIDGKTNLRTLYLRINSIQKPKPGQFVSIEITGKKLTNLLKIPVTSITQDGKVWFVDKENLLRKYNAIEIYSKDQYVFIKKPEKILNHKKTESFNVVVYPYTSYIQGKKVTTKVSNQTHFIKQ